MSVLNVKIRTEVLITLMGPAVALYIGGRRMVLPTEIAELLADALSDSARAASQGAAASQTARSGPVMPPDEAVREIAMQTAQSVHDLTQTMRRRGIHGVRPEIALRLAETLGHVLASLAALTDDMRGENTKRDQVLDAVQDLVGEVLERLDPTTKKRDR